MVSIMCDASSCSIPYRFINVSNTPLVQPKPSCSAYSPPDASADILNALLALGYNEREALGAMKQLPTDIAVSEGIRQALKSLSKG